MFFKYKFKHIKKGFVIFTNVFLNNKNYKRLDFKF